MARSKSWLLTLLLMALAFTLVLAVPVLAKGKPTTPGEDPDGVNRVAVPIIFADGVTMGNVPMGVPASDNLSTQVPLHYSTFVEGVALTYPYDLQETPALLLSDFYYPQKTAANWQAATVNGKDGVDDLSPWNVTRFDWGDALLAKAWGTTSKIRVEFAMYRVNDLLLVGYPMNHLQGAGITEVWGTPAASALGAAVYVAGSQQIVPGETMVYSSGAKLTISPLTTVDGAIAEGLPVVDIVLSAEVNVGGKVIYGYNWEPKNDPDGALPAGDYRVRFSLADGANVIIDDLDPLDAPPVPPVTITEEEMGFTPILEADGKSTYCDIQLVESTGGGGGGGGGGGNRPW